MRRGTRLAVLLVGLTLANCDWLGETAPDPLPGTRIPVLQATRSFEPDARLASQPVRLPRPQRNPEWPQAGGYPDHAMHHLELPDALTEAWRVSIGSGSSRTAQLQSPPVVAGGVVYTLDVSGVVTALDVKDGRQVWRVDIRPGDEEAVASGGLAFGNGMLYAATGFAEVVALDPQTGKDIWRQPVTSPMRAGPTVTADRVLVVTVENQTIALSPQDGKRLWNHAGLSEVAGLLGGASPAAEGNLAVVGYSSGEVTALRTDTGRVAWADTLTAIRRIDAVSALADIRARPVIDRGVVLAISNSGRAAAIDLRSGGRLWDREIPGIQMPWVAGDYVYLLTTTGDLLCLTRRDGRIRWSQALPRWENPERQRGRITWAGPVLGGDRLIMVGSTGEALSVSPYTGDILGRQSLPGRTQIAPVIADGTLYVLTDDATLVAYR